MSENFDFQEIWKNFHANGDVCLNFGNIFAQYRYLTIFAEMENNQFSSQQYMYVDKFCSGAANYTWLNIPRYNCHK